MVDKKKVIEDILSNFANSVRADWNGSHVSDVSRDKEKAVAALLALADMHAIEDKVMME